MEEDYEVDNFLNTIDISTIIELDSFYFKKLEHLPPGNIREHTRIKEDLNNIMNLYRISNIHQFHDILIDRGWTITLTHLLSYIREIMYDADYAMKSRPYNMYRKYT